MSTSLLPPVISTKLFAPPNRPDLVPRPRLTERIIAASRAGAKIAVISAPPGFGKSTCAAEVVAAFHAEGKAATWLALDAEDNDAARFLVHLIAAVEQAIAGTGQAALAHLTALVAEGTPTPPPVPVLALLANALIQANQRLLIVLDDYHLLEEPRLHHALAAWVEQLPPGVMVLLCTRAEPPLPLARWRVRRHLIEVRVTDLQFTEEETAAFFQQATPLSFSAGAAAVAQRRTEGWVAGLQMVALALEAGEGIEATATDPAAWLATVGGDDRYIADYLIEEVLARQPQAMQDFLLQSAVVERLHGPLCDALLALPPGTGQSMLEEVERGNLFLVPLDQRRQWYRYHHLFRDLLLRQLDRRHPEVVPTLHQRAAQWYASQGLLDEAIEEALGGEIWEVAVELMVTLFPTVLRQGRWTTMRRWLAALPADRLAASPQLCTWYAQMLIYTGEPIFGSELLAKAEDALRAANDLSGLAEVLTVRISLARLQDRPEQVRALAAQIHALATPLSPPTELTIACNLAIAAQQAGEGHRAIDQCIAVLGEASIQGALILNLLVLSHLGDAYAALGEAEAAATTYQRVFDLAEGRNLFPLLRAHMGMAALLADKDQAQARQHAEEAIRLAQASDRTLYTAPALLTLARLAAVNGEVTGAELLAQQSLELARKLGNARQEEDAKEWLAHALPLARSAAVAYANASARPASPLIEALTARETEVLHLLDAGASNQQIAEELVISLNTVKKHIANVLGKLQAESRTHALARARAAGLL